MAAPVDNCVPMKHSMIGLGPRPRPKCHIVQVRNNPMQSIIPNALMRWNSAFATDVL